MVIMHVLTNPILSLQLGILGILWGGMVSGGNYKLGTGISYVHQCVCGQWPWL